MHVPPEPVGDDHHVYSPNDFYRLGWVRWMPANLDLLMIAVADATVREIDGTLDELIDRLHYRFRYPQGGDTPLVWSFEELDETEPDDKDDEEPDSYPTPIADQFATAVGHLAGPPATIRDIADVLIKLGVFTFEQTDDTERWRLVTPMPLPTEVLRLPPDVAAEEDRMRWNHTVVAGYVNDILSALENAESPAAFDTTIERFARTCDLDPIACREGLESLVNSGELTVSRHGQPADITQVAEHNRITLAFRWERIHENRIKIIQG